MSVDLTPLLIVFLTVLGGAGAYAYQRRIDRSEKLIEKRREIFADYVTAIQLNMIGEKDNSVFQRAYANIFVYGTDDVIRAVSNFHNEMADKAGTINKNRATAAYAEMVKAMREDCFSSSDLTSAELTKLVPFK